MSLAKLLFGRQWWWVTLLVAGIVGLFLRLGVWQLNRLEERQAANVSLLATLDAPPIDLNEVVLPTTIEALKDRSVVATGTFDFEAQLILLQQRWQGQLGAHLITPLVLADGKTAVLVDRGWINNTDAESGDWSQFDVIGSQKVEGYVALSKTVSGGRENVALPAGARTYRVDVRALQAKIPYTLHPFYIIQSPPEGEQVPPIRQAQAVDLSEGPHLSYAIQWFLFAVVGTVGYLAFVSKTAAATKLKQDDAN